MDEDFNSHTALPISAVDANQTNEAFYWTVAVSIVITLITIVGVFVRHTLLEDQQYADEDDGGSISDLPEKNFDTAKPSKRVPVSVNFHFTRVCNYACGFCFHTAKTSHLTPLEDAKRGLKMLADKGMKKLNLSGGEPFTQEKYVGEICKFSKEVLNLESVSIVSNGSKIKKRFFVEYGKFVDILAISVDSFDEETNIKIGRGK
jgi:sulfatase maturation enzyme AslB (radical SAM superfamily)